MSNHAWSAFFVRISLALFVGMIGHYKVMVMGVDVHAQQFFIEGFKDHWIPQWLLLTLGYVIPYVELLCGLMLFIGLLVRFNLIIIGFLLMIVAYGHLLQDAFYNPVSHWLPRFVLLIALFLLHDKQQDKCSVDHYIHRKKRN